MLALRFSYRNYISGCGVLRRILDPAGRRSGSVSWCCTSLELSLSPSLQPSHAKAHLRPVKGERQFGARLMLCVLGLSLSSVAAFCVLLDYAG